MSDFPYFRRALTASREAVAGTAVRPRRIGAIGRLFGAVNVWFWAIVGVPTLVAAVYYFGIASNCTCRRPILSSAAPGPKSPWASPA